MFTLFYPVSGLHLNKDRPYFVTRSSKKFFLGNNNVSSHAVEEKSSFDLVKNLIALVLLMKANQSESEWTIQVQVHTTARSSIFGIQFKYIYIFKQRIVAASFCSDTKHLTKIIPTDLKKNSMYWRHLS